MSGLDDWNVSGVTSMNQMFQFCYYNGLTIDLSNWNISKMNNFSQFFLGTFGSGNVRIDNWNIPSGCTCDGMFGDLYQNQVVSLSGWKFLGNNNCDGMFAGFNQSNLNFNPISNYLETWDTSGIVNMRRMFYTQRSFNANLSNWNTSNVTNMSLMFTSTNIFSTNFSGWDTSNVTNMSQMFQNTFSNIQGLENWNVGKVTNMSNMFGGIALFNANLSGWDTGKVTNMSSMFENCNSFVGSGIDNWNVTGVTDINRMLRTATPRTNLNVNLSGWNLCNCTNMTNFMIGSNIGTGNYSILLNSWADASTGNPIKPWATGINVHFGTSRYTAASSGARQRLINYGWTITDGGFQA
jgi:surface protein